MKKLILAASLGLASSAAYSYELSCSNSEVQVQVATEGYTPASVTTAAGNYELDVLDYALTTDGSGALVLENGVLVVAINELGELSGEFLNGDLAAFNMVCSYQ